MPDEREYEREKAATVAEKPSQMNKSFLPHPRKDCEAGNTLQVQTGATGAYCQSLNWRTMIEERIHYHNRTSSNLHTLLRAIPQDLSYEAAEAMAALVIGSKA